MPMSTRMFPSSSSVLLDWMAQSLPSLKMRPFFHSSMDTKMIPVKLDSKTSSMTMGKGNSSSWNVFSMMVLLSANRDPYKRENKAY